MSLVINQSGNEIFILIIRQAFSGARLFDSENKIFSIELIHKELANSKLQYA